MWDSVKRRPTVFRWFLITYQVALNFGDSRQNRKRHLKDTKKWEADRRPISKCLWKIGSVFAENFSEYTSKYTLKRHFLYELKTGFRPVVKNWKEFRAKIRHFQKTLPKYTSTTSWQRALDHSHPKRGEATPLGGFEFLLPSWIHHTTRGPHWCVLVVVGGYDWLTYVLARFYFLWLIAFCAVFLWIVHESTCI